MPALSLTKQVWVYLLYSVTISNKVYSIALHHAEATIGVTRLISYLLSLTKGLLVFCRLQTIENMGELPRICGYYLGLPLTHNLNVPCIFNWTTNTVQTLQPAYLDAEVSLRL